MSPKPAALTLLGLSTGLSEGTGPRLNLATPSGAVRSVDLTRADLVRLIGAAASALAVLDREEGKR